MSDALIEFPWNPYSKTPPLMMARLMQYLKTEKNKKEHQTEVITIKNLQRRTLRGVIIPVDWDENGSVKAIAISTHDEEEYLIYKDSKGKELFPFLQSFLELSGNITEVAGLKIIKVKNVGITNLETEIHLNKPVFS
jgi:hypothetical protein